METSGRKQTCWIKVGSLRHGPWVFNQWLLWLQLQLQEVQEQTTTLRWKWKCNISMFQAEAMKRGLVLFWVNQWISRHPGARKLQQKDRETKTTLCEPWSASSWRSEEGAETPEEEQKQTWSSACYLKSLFSLNVLHKMMMFQMFQMFSPLLSLRLFLNPAHIWPRSYTTELFQNYVRYSCGGKRPEERPGDSSWSRSHAPPCPSTANQRTGDLMTLRQLHSWEVTVIVPHIPDRNWTRPHRRWQCDVTWHTWTGEGRPPRSNIKLRSFQENQDTAVNWCDGWSSHIGSKRIENLRLIIFYKLYHQSYCRAGFIDVLFIYLSQFLLILLDFSQTLQTFPSLAPKMKQVTEN